VLKGFNDMVTTNPQLASEWNYDKNGDLRPDMVIAGNKRCVWWKCPNGHEWQAKCYHRSNGSGCPYCSGRLAIKGENDLATINPELLSEWDYKKNGKLMPDVVMPGSENRVWWKCETCAYEWNAMVCSRSKGAGCPSCGKKTATRKSLQTKLSIHGSFYDWCLSKATQGKNLLVEWDKEKNGDLQPAMLLASSHKRVWWKCNVCKQEWQTAVYVRTSGSGCPSCAREKRGETRKRNRADHNNR
jgi:Probable Zinc-ribbon domain